MLTLKLNFSIFDKKKFKVTLGVYSYPFWGTSHKDWNVSKDLRLLLELF